MLPLPVVRSMATRPALSTAEIEALRIHGENHPSLGGFKGHVLDFFWVTDPLCGVLNPSLSHWLLAAAVADCIGFGVMIGDIRRWTCSCQWVTIPFPQKQVPQIWVQKCFFCCFLHVHHPWVAERQTMHLTVGDIQGEPK